MIRTSHIKATVADAGIRLCGIAPAMNLAGETAFLDRWMADGMGAHLDYLARNRDFRSDISGLVPGARSVIVCAFPYRNRFSGTYDESFRGKIASYALAEDYHTSIRRILSRILSTISEAFPGVSGRVFTDSAPIFEKAYAVRAGLGWIGRQSLLVTPEYGTYVLLGEIVIDAECDEYDEPMPGRQCGQCRRCIDACPNSAVIDRHIDCRRCISRATIERKDCEDVDLHGWVFGCDQCQACCPYSASSPVVGEAMFDPTAIDWKAMSPDSFETTFSSTPLSRSGLERIRRNAERNVIRTEQ